MLALNTWARPGAILSLNLKRQINDNSGIVHLNPEGRRQNKKYRPDIRLTDNLSAWVKEWDCEYPISREGEPLTTIKKVFKAHAKRMGMPQMTPYSLRHFMGTNIRRVEGCEVSREQRQEWLGHKPQDTTSWYEHFDPEWLREAMMGTDRILSRLDGLLKTRTLVPITSQTTLKSASDRPSGLKLVVSK